MTQQFRQIEDALLMNDTALPAAASTTVTTAAIDLNAFSATNSAIRLGNVEAGLSIPALSTTILPDTRTMTLSIEESDSATFASGVETLRSVVLTGAGGVGVTVATLLQTRIPPNGARYVRGKLVSGASTTDASALLAHFALKF